MIKDRSCTLFSKDVKEDPCGSAPSWDKIIFLEIERPWKSEITESKKFPEELKSIADTVPGNIRFQGIVPDDEYSQGDGCRVIFFNLDENRLNGYNKFEFLVPRDKLIYLIEGLINDKNLLQDFTEYQVQNSIERDIFVCVHGSRDTCCASFGSPVYQYLRNQLIPKFGSLRVWQSSHIGGHKFAPNIIDFPSGRNWVRLTEQEAEVVVNSKGSTDFLTNCYRGNLAYKNQFEQIVERELFSLYGWEWINKSVNFSSLENVNDKTFKLGAVVNSDTDTKDFNFTITETHNIDSIDCKTGQIKESVPQYSIVESSNN